MATKYSNNLEVQINQPLDTKHVCENLSDLTNYLYVGLLTYQKSDGKYYSYKGKVDGNHVWEEIKSGGGLPTTNLIKNSNFEVLNDGTIAGSQITSGPDSYMNWWYAGEAVGGTSGGSGTISQIIKNGYLNYSVAKIYQFSFGQSLNLIENKRYTLSFIYKTEQSQSTNNGCYINHLSGISMAQVSKTDNIGDFIEADGVKKGYILDFSENWTKASITFTAAPHAFTDTTSELLKTPSFICAADIEVTLYITCIKLEEGDEATDYTRWEDRIITGEEFEKKQDILISGTNIKTINGNSILGNGNIEIKGSDLGISSPLYYLGITTTEMVDGYDKADVTIGNEVITAVTGAVVFYNDTEFIYNGSIWEELGSGSVSTKYDTTLGDLATETTIGGIPAGTTADSLKNKTFTQMFDTLLFPDKDPTHSNPSVGGFALSPATSPVEINSAVATISSATLNKGQWNQYNGGLAYAGDITSTVYEIKINGSTYNAITNLPSVYTTPGNHTYKATVNYAAGPTPVNNKGVQRPSLAAPAGAVTATRTVNVTYPYYIMGASGLVEKLTACTISGTNGTITAPLNHTVPAVNADSDKTVIKVKGTLSSLMIVDPFATGGKSDLLPDLISSQEVDTGYTIYSYSSDTVKGEVVITNLIITFTI